MNIGKATSNNFQSVFTGAVYNGVADDDVALLLSGGVDSISCGVTAHDLGKSVRAYSFRLDSNDCSDHQKAREVCEYMGWKFTSIIVPTGDLRADLFRLRDLGCTKKTHFECLFPFLYVYPHIQEQIIITGWAADGYFGLSRAAQLKWNCRASKRHLDDFRDDYFQPDNCAGLQPLLSLTKSHSKTLVTPYLDAEVRAFFYQFDWDQLNRPQEKHHIRDSFRIFSDLHIPRHSNLQLNSGIPSHFENLLSDTSINPSGYRSVQALLQAFTKDYSPEPRGLEHFF